MRVNAVLPGPVMLPADLPAAEREEAINATLVKREGSPANVAQAVLYLLDNDFVTGDCLRSHTNIAATATPDAGLTRGSLRERGIVEGWTAIGSRSFSAGKTPAPLVGGVAQERSGDGRIVAVRRWRRGGQVHLR